MNSGQIKTCPRHLLLHGATEEEVLLGVHTLWEMFRSQEQTSYVTGSPPTRWCRCDLASSLTVCVYTVARAAVSQSVRCLTSTARLTPTSSKLMFHVRTVPALSRAGADFPFKRLLSSRRLRSTVTSTSTSATQAEPQDDVSGARYDSARSEFAGQPGRGRRDGTTTAANEISVDFDQTQEAYKSKDSLELLRSLVVFKLCSYDFLVDKNKEVMGRCFIFTWSPDVNLFCFSGDRHRRL